MQLLAVCLLACVASVIAETNQPVPVLFHANTHTFLHSSSSDVMSSDSFTSLLQDLVTPRTSSLVNGASAPEVLLAVVYDKLDFATLAREMGAYGRASASPLSEIKPLMTSATSSITIPYAHPAPFYRSTLSHIVSTMSSLVPAGEHIVMGSELASSKNTITLQSCDELISYITTSKLFNNDVTDVIVLSVPTTSTCPSQVLSSLSSSPSTLVMYTAQQTTHDIHTTWDVSPAAAVAYQTHAVGDVAPTGAILAHNLHFTTGPTRLTPNILIGLLVMFFLLFVLYMGVSCLMAVERPVRMSSTVLQVSKEY